MQLNKYYENDGLNRCLYIRLNADQSINAYQMRVLENMNPDFTLPATVISKGDERLVCYTVNTRLDLEKTLDATGNLSRNQFETLMNNILEIFLSNKRQQLKPEYFIVHPEYIFFRKNSGDFKPQLVYLPLEDMENNLLDQFKALIRYLIPLKVNYSEDEMFYREVLAAVSSDTFTLNELKEILDKPSGKAGPKEDNSRDIVVSRASDESKKQNKQGNAAPAKEKIQQKSAKPESSNTGEKKAVKEESKTDNVTAGLPSGKRTLVIALLQVLFVLVSIMLAIIINITGPKMIIGFILIMITLDFLSVYMVMKKMPAKKEVAAVTAEKKSAKQKEEEKPVYKEPPVSAPTDDKTEVLFPPVKEDAADKTEVLISRAKLIRLKDDVPFTLAAGGKTKVGRTGGNDIVIDKKTVSGSHAEIECINNEYYIKDLNSKNGTLLNGKKLTAEELYPIEDGAIITFADEDYKFQK